MSTYTAPFLLIRRNGETIEFATLGDLAAAVRAAGILVERYHVREITRHTGLVEAVHNEWIVRDDFGRIVTRDAWENRSRRFWWGGSRDKLVLHAESLRLPIPFCGRRMRGYSSTLRHPRHMSVYRAHAALAHEPIDERARGRIKLPPNAWDDICRDDQDHHSWKRHRRYQAKRR